MTKKKLIERLARQLDISQQKAKQVIDITFQAMADTLIEEDRVEIRGFGSFVVRYYAGYEGKNPKTGETVEVKPKKLPFFKVGKELKHRVDSN